MADPKVSVLMSVFNGERHLRAAIDSILKQTFQDFEFIIIDDGSTDRTNDIIRSFSDFRIRLFNNEKNIGLTRSLNKGIDLCRGEYIARMDGDDVSLPMRLEKQVEFMMINKDVGISGAWNRSIGQNLGVICHYPVEDSDIRCMLLFNNTFCHPTLIMRREFIQTYGLSYDSKLQYAQDYDLVVRGSEHFLLANIPEVLLHYRLHPAQIAKNKRKDQIRAGDYVRDYQLRKLSIHPSSRELQLIFNFSALMLPPTKELVKESYAWLAKLRSANDEALVYDGTAMKHCIGNQWFKLCNAYARLGLWVWRTFRNSSLSSFDALDAKQSTKFFSKCLVASTLPFLNYITSSKKITPKSAFRTLGKS